MIKTIEQLVGNTPMVELKHINPNSSNKILAKLEGNNPSNSVKDRAALSMIQQAELRGDIKQGDTIIEPTSGNTGISLAMIATIKGYKMTLIMPENMTEERKASMRAYGAKIITVPVELGMPGARDLAIKMQENGEGVLLDQFNNSDNSLAHYKTTGPEIWQQTEGKITHFVSAMGTTGTIIGTSKYLKEQNNKIISVGLRPADGSKIPGILKWAPEYLPKIFNADLVDEIIDIEQTNAEETMRLLAKKEAIMAGVSSGCAVYAAMKLSEKLQNATIVCVICDKGDRYLSTGLYDK